MNNKLHLYALIGISGVGKSHLTKYVLNNSNKDLVKLIAVTTRAKRDDEINGIDKYFLSTKEFKLQKENLSLVRKMYGAYYGFRKCDLNTDNTYIVELYYKDYIKLKRAGYSVTGIYIWTTNSKCRKDALMNSNRNQNSFNYFRRSFDDFFINIIHKCMLKLKLFDYDICNDYTQDSLEKILTIIEKGT